MNKWESILHELERKKAFSKSQGGEDRIAKYKQSGKLTARERAAALFDDGDFFEIGALAANLSDASEHSAPADGLVAGFGHVNGRPALTMIEDFTVMAGSIGDAGSSKRERIARLAKQEQLPLIIMLEGAGHRLTNKHSNPAPNDLQALADLSGTAPIITIVMGPSAGHSALAAPLADFSIMTKAASLFVAGPPIVKAAIGEEVTKEQLGGPDVHIRQSGVIHNLAENDLDAITMARNYLSYLGGGKSEDGSKTSTAEQPIEEICDLIDPDPRVPFDAYKLLELITDPNSLFPVQPEFGASVIAALARIDGRCVAIVANNPAVRAGTIDSFAAQKATDFMQVADTFKLPVIFLTDNPGVMPGTASEKTGTLRYAARMFAAQHSLTVPKIHVTLRKAFGFGSSVMAMNPFDNQTLSLAFPAISLGAMPADAGAKSAGLSGQEAANAAKSQTGSAWNLSDKLAFDDVIDPRDLRSALITGLAMAKRR